MKKVYWKNLFKSVSSSKGRFFSIFSLMFIGAVTLVGLKVTSPNMERLAQATIGKTQMMDLAVIADMGLDKEDQAELSSIPHATVEYSYTTDVTRKGTTDAVRIYSQTEKISLFQLISGQLPSQPDQIALDTSLKGDYQLGGKIEFSQSDKGSLKKTTFTVTGFVHSPEIWSTKNLGNSSAGSGSLTAYAVVSKEAFDSDVYMIARLRYDDLKDLVYTSSTYDKRLAKHSEELEKLVADNGSLRLARVKSDGQKDIQQGQEKVADAENQLSQSAQKIADGEQQIADGDQQITAAKEQIAKGENQLAKTEQQLKEAAATLTSKKAELDKARSDLDASKAQLDASRSQLDSAKSQLDQAQETIAQKQAELDAAAGQIQSGQLALQTAKNTLQEQIESLTAAGEDPSQNPAIQAAQAKIAQDEETLEASLTNYNQGFAALENAKAAYQVQETTYQSGEQEYANGLAQYQAGESSYQTGLTQYQAAQATYQYGVAQYETGKADLQSSQATIAEKEAQLGKSKTEIATAKDTYTDKKSEADKKISDSKEKLTDAETKLSKLEEPNYLVYNRKTIPGGTGYENYRVATGSISAVGTIFPIVLYLVAAMVTFTTMTRFVDEERTNAGIFKALGYTNHDIIRKFILYGLVASILGSVVGVIVGSYWLSPIISNIVTEHMVVGAAPTFFYPRWLLTAIVLGLISAVLPAYLVAHRDLKENAAQLLLPKPPVSGSTILLEKISFIWKRLTFTQKVTVRNIFRYKQRMLMTIFGVAGSVALLFAGLGIRSSISGLVNRQFSDLLQYDMIVVKNSAASKAEANTVEKEFLEKSVDSHLSISYQSLEQSIPHQDEKQATSLLVTEQADQLSDYIRLSNRKNGEPLTLSSSGVIITEKLAQLYDAKVGDKITLTIDNQEVSVEVTGIAEMYAGHSVYMTADYYKKATGQAPTDNAWLVKLTNHQSNSVKSVSAKFLQLAGVSAVVQNTTMVATIDNLAQSLQSIMLILIVLSLLLGIVILYNLTNINVAERIRELSTIKVLGFHNKEVTLYIYRETILLSLVGIVLGLLGGRALHLLILDMIGTDSIMFNPTVTWDVYLTPVLAILGILAVLGWFVNYHLRKVDMLEALKSVE